jgi:hypothetical protein
MSQKFVTWITDPVNIALTITYMTALMQSLATETGWRWAHIVSNVLSSLPGLNIKGLLTAGKK